MLSISVSPMHQGKDLWDLMSSSVCLEGPVLGSKGSLKNTVTLSESSEFRRRNKTPTPAHCNGRQEVLKVARQG